MTTDQMEYTDTDYAEVIPNTTTDLIEACTKDEDSIFEAAWKKAYREQGFIFASDGYSALRLPLAWVDERVWPNRPTDQNEQQVARDIRHLFEEMEPHRIGGTTAYRLSKVLKKVPLVSGTEQVECDECKGRAKTLCSCCGYYRPCDACDGDGYHEVDTDTWQLDEGYSIHIDGQPLAPERYARAIRLARLLDGSGVTVSHARPNADSIVFRMGDAAFVVSAMVEASDLDHVDADDTLFVNDDS